MKYQGQCHCGAVCFEVNAPEILECTECNCSICSKSGYLHLIVDDADFQLKQGREFLSTYTFGTETAKHYFCKKCGIKSFYVPRSHPSGFSVNVRCLNGSPEYTVTSFDGQHWEESIHQIRK